MEADQFSGAEIDESIVAAMYDAFDQSREVNTEDVLNAVRATKPLAVTMKEKIDSVREWAKDRTRPATTVTTVSGKAPVRRLTHEDN